MLREIVVRTTLGVDTPVATAYEVAARIPEAIFFILAGGAIGAAFIPTFTAYFERDDSAGGAQHVLVCDFWWRCDSFRVVR